MILCLTYQSHYALYTFSVRFARVSEVRHSGTNCLIPVLSLALWAAGLAQMPMSVSFNSTPQLACSDGKHKVQVCATSSLPL